MSTISYYIAVDGTDKVTHVFSTSSDFGPPSQGTGYTTYSVSASDYQSAFGVLHQNGAYYTNSTLTLVPAAPGANYTWDWTAKAWNYDLVGAQEALNATLTAAYAAAIQADVSFTTSAGVTQTFQADSASISNLNNMIAAFGGTKTVPAGFYWKAKDNTQVPFTYADMQGLAAAIGSAAYTAFQHLQTLKAQVAATTTAAELASISW
jgi:hypothetical protein